MGAALASVLLGCADQASELAQRDTTRDLCAVIASVEAAIENRCIVALERELAQPINRFYRWTQWFNNKGPQWFELAIHRRDADAIAVIARAGFDPSSSESASGRKPIVLAATHGFAHGVRALAHADARVDATDSRGFSAITAAAYSRDADTIFAVAESNAKLEALIADHTAMTIVIYHGQPSELKALLEAGTNPDTTPNGHFSAIHTAVWQKRIDMLEILLRGGANPNVLAPSSRGETAIMQAARFDRYDMVALLLKYGADLHQKDKHGKNVTDYAEFFRKPEMSDYFCRLGVEPTPLDHRPPNNEQIKRKSCAEPSPFKPSRQPDTTMR